jgi:zinc protease
MPRRLAALAVLTLLLVPACTPAPAPPPAATAPAAPARILPGQELLRDAADHPAYGAESYRLISQPDEIVSVLRNGLTVVIKRVPSPVTSVRGYVMAGSVYEGRWMGGGLSHLLEHLVAGGTNDRRSEAENRNLLQELGNNSNAYTYNDRTAYFVNTTTANAEKAVDLVTGWLFTAHVTPAEYRREYQVVQRELEKDKGEPDWVYYELTNFNRYRVSPQRVPVIGYQEVIRGLSRDDVYAYYKLAYVPNNMVFVVAGDRDPEELLAMVQKHVRDVKPGRGFSHDIVPEPPVSAPRTLVATFPKLGPARVQLAFPSIRIAHDDLYALDLLSAVLGGGDSSLLNEEIRDKRQLVTAIACSNPTPAHVEGTFTIDFQCEASKLKEASDAVLDLLDRVKRDGVDATRAARGKSILRTVSVYGRQTSETIAESLADGFLSTGDVHFLDRYTDRIQKVEPASLKTVAGRYFDRDRLITTVLLPEEFVGAAGLPKAQDVVAAAKGKPATTQTATPVERVVFDNGTVLLVKRMAASPVVSINLFALGGVAAEDAQSNGLGNLAMQMLSRGTKDRNAQQIAETFDALGAALEAGCGNNSWFWKATCLKEDFAKTMAAYADVVNHAAFPDAELAPMKQRVLAEIEGQDADWFAQSMRFFRQTYFAPLQSPYQFTIIGTADNVKNFTREQVSKWYAERIQRAPRVLAIYGDVDLAQAKQLAADYFGKGERRPEGPTEAARGGGPDEDGLLLGRGFEGASAASAVKNGVAPPDHPAALTISRVEVNKTANPQAGVVIGFRSDSVVGAPDQPAIDVADCLTSGYGFPTGYIFETLRGRGLVYDANARDFPGLSRTTPGVFFAYAGCDPKNVNECVDVILESVARLQGSDADMQADWFDRARRLIVTGDAIDKETPAAQAQLAALDELYGLGHAYHERFAARINTVTPDRVRHLANTRLRECVVTVTTPAPDQVKITPGERSYRTFPQVDLAPKGVQHAPAGGNK